MNDDNSIDFSSEKEDVNRESFLLCADFVLSMIFYGERSYGFVLCDYSAVTR